MRGGITIPSVLLIMLSFGEPAHIRKYNGGYGTCDSTTNCGVNSCCRDDNGNVIDDRAFGLPIIEKAGQCRNKLGKPGTVCTPNCGCEEGYACYRPMTGVCCAPSTCHNSTWVREQREFWKNCFETIGCHLPPSVNPDPLPRL